MLTKLGGTFDFDDSLDGTSSGRAYRLIPLLF